MVVTDKRQFKEYPKKFMLHPKESIIFPYFTVTLQGNCVKKVGHGQAAHRMKSELKSVCHPKICVDERYTRVVLKLDGIDIMIHLSSQYGQIHYESDLV